MRNPKSANGPVSNRNGTSADLSTAKYCPEGLTYSSLGNPKTNVVGLN